MGPGSSGVAGAGSSRPRPSRGATSRRGSWARPHQKRAQQEQQEQQQRGQARARAGTTTPTGTGRLGSGTGAATATCTTTTRPRVVVRIVRRRVTFLSASSRGPVGAGSGRPCAPRGWASWPGTLAVRSFFGGGEAGGLAGWLAWGLMDVTAE